MQAPFFLRNTASAAVKELLNQTVLGTKGARYKHLNTNELLEQLDEPLFLSLERNERALGNVTFCRRKGDWYIRYFAFASHLQAEKKKQNAKPANSLFKKGIEQFFAEKLKEEAKSFYAYIDPSNERSKWISETFGFQESGILLTQSFSRLRPKIRPGFEVLAYSNEVLSMLATFSEQRFYTDYQAPRVKFAALRNPEGELVAFCKYQTAHWRIDRLPGKMGGLLVKILPYLPVISSLFKPKNHRFLVPEAVYVKGNDSQLLSSLFESILALEKHRLLLWWTDHRDPLLKCNQTRVNWGIFHRLLGNPPVKVYARYAEKRDEAAANESLIYVSGMDLI